MKYKLMPLAIILWQHATIVYSCTDLQSGRLIGALHRHTCTSEIFAILPWAPKVRSYLQSMEQGYSLSLLPVLQLTRLAHSQWLAPLFGMGFHWRCDCSPGFTLTHSSPALEMLLLAVLE